MKVLVLGAKEYPFGSGKKEDDPYPSGGAEIYITQLLKYMNKKITFLVITRHFKALKKREKTKNIEIIRVPFIRGFYTRNPTFNFFSFLKAMQTDFDIIMSHDVIASFFGIILSKVKRKPLIAVCHGIASEQPQYPKLIRFLLRCMEKAAYRKASITVTHSPDKTSKITKNFVVIYPGFDRKGLLKQSKKERKKLIEKYKLYGKTVIIYTGRLIGVKGIEYLLKSLAYIRHPYVCFIVGDGPQKARYQKMAKKIGANVIFTGFTKNVCKYLYIADIFVMPSLSESLNYSLIEAAYAGLPLIVTDIGIIEKEYAILVKPKNAKSIGDAINKIIEHPEISEELKRKSRQFAIKFNWKKAAKEYEKLIKNL